MARIQILGQNGDYIELGENIEVPLNFSIADIKDIEKRKASFSKTITVPGTKRNHDILKHYYNVNIENGDFINNIVKCALIGDSGEILFNNGVIQLLRVVKRNVVATGEDKVNYEILLKDDAGDFFTNMSNKKLEDLFMQDLNHRYDLATVSASTFHTAADGYKYILPYIQPQGLPTDNQYKLTELKPGIYAERYLKSIFQSNGYTYTWAEANSNDIQFDKLIVPYNGDVPKLDEEDIQQFRVVAELSGVTTFPLAASFQDDVKIPPIAFPDGIGRAQMILTNEIEDIQSLYNPTLGKYIPNYDAQLPGGIDYQFEIDYDVLFFNDEPVGVFLVNKGVPLSAGTKIAKFEIISTVKNNTQNINFDHYFDSFELGKDYTLTPGNNIVHSATKTFSQTAPNVNSFNELINGLAIQVSNIFQDEFDKEAKWRTNLGDDTVIVYQIRINSIRMTILPSVDNAASYGAIINMNKFVPKNIQQKDFLKSITTMFNLFIIPDENNPGNLIIKNKDTYYSEGNITDWTYYLAKDLPQEITFLSDLNAKRLTLTYKQDSDVPNKGYFDNTGEIYGQSEFVFDNEYTKGDEKKEIIFSPTPNANTSFAANLPIITGAAPKTNIRILYDGGNLPCQEYTIIETGQIASGFTTYPYVGHFDKPVDSNYDLNFSTPDYLFYDNFNTITQNNLFNKFWSNTFSQINNSKVLTAYFILDDSIISKFRMNDKIYLKQYESYWVVNQIYDYIVGGKVPTKVELVQVQDLGVRPIVKSYKKPSQVEFPAPGKRFKYLNSAPNRSDINIYGFDNYVTNNSTQIEIIGSNNNVGGSNIQIYGNDNIDYWNNSIINISNLTVTNPNSVNNEVIQGLDIWVRTGTNNAYLNYGGHDIDTASTFSIIAGGYDNFISTSTIGSSIFGGHDHLIGLGVDSSSIIGGYNNLIDTNSDDTVLLGTTSSTATTGSVESIIAGGYQQLLDAAPDSAIIGGGENSIVAADATVVLGGYNIAATASETVYVPNLNVNYVPQAADGTETLLVRAADGTVKESLAVLSAITASTGLTWSQVLSNGNTSGPTNPVLTNGTSIGGGEDPSIALATNILYLGDSTVSDGTWYLGDLYANTSEIRFDGTNLHVENGTGGYSRIQGTDIRLDASGEIIIINQPLTASTSADILLREPTGEIHILPLSGVSIPTSSTWADVLANGNVSGPTNPILSDGKRIGGGDDPDTASSVNVLDLGDSTVLDSSWYLGDRDFNLAAIRYNYGANSLKMASTGNVEVTASGAGSGFGLNLFGGTDSGIQILDNSTNPRASEAIDSYSIFIGTNNSTIDDGVINSVVIGGFDNLIESSHSLILGGDTNQITDVTSAESVICAGFSNIIDASGQSFIAAGAGNNIINTSNNSVILAANASTLDGTSNSAIIATSASGVISTFDYTLHQSDSYRDADNHTLQTTNNTTTTLYSFTPDTNGVWMIEANTTGFENATGDAIGAKSFAVFKVIGGVVTQVAGTTLDRKSNFPASVTVTIDTDGTNIRIRVTGRTGSTIEWRSSITKTK